MPSKKLRSIKGRAMRITRLDECGAPVVGPCSSIVTYGFISIAYSGEIEKGDEYKQKNAWGEFCINEKDPDLTKWINVKASFCEVDPGILDIIAGGNPVTSGSDTIGATFGQNPPTGAFAIEVWTKVAGTDACAPGGGPQQWGYFVVPFAKNGMIDGDLSIGNAPLNLNVTAEGYAASAAWGMTPYGDNPLMASAGFPVGDQFGLVITTVQPPAATDGCVALAEPPVKGAAQAGDVFPAEPTVTAEDATNAGKLAALGYVASPATAWASGEFMTIGAFKFNWTGSAWAAGAHA